jgi:coenzyme PQQ synthesis protein D (PqqD)
MTASTNVPSTVTDDGVVMVDVSSGKIFQSNPIGSRIWIKLQGGTPVARIVDEISAEFRVPREQVEAEVQEYIQSLTTGGLIVEN